MLTGYPKKVRIQTGTDVTIRPMAPEDADRLYTFFNRVSLKDRVFLRDDVSKREVIDAWARDLDYERVLPLLAEVGENIVGDVTLHRRGLGWARHVGKIRILVDQDYRDKGLGTILILEVITLAKKAGLERLVVEIMDSQKVALDAFKNLGFEKEAVLSKFVKDQEGREHDLIVMVKNLEGEPVPVTF